MLRDENNALSLLLVSHEIHDAAYIVLARHHRLVLATIDVNRREAAPVVSTTQRFKQIGTVTTNKIISTKLCNMHLHIAISPTYTPSILDHYMVRYTFVLRNMNELKDFCMRISVAEMSPVPEIALHIQFNHKPSRIQAQMAYEKTMFAEIGPYFWTLQRVVVYDCVAYDIAKTFVDNSTTRQWSRGNDMIQEVQDWILEGLKFQNDKNHTEARACFAWAHFRLLAAAQRKHELEEYAIADRSLRGTLMSLFRQLCNLQARSLLTAARKAKSDGSKIQFAREAEAFCTVGVNGDDRISVTRIQPLRRALLLYNRSKARQLLGHWENARSDCVVGGACDPDALRAKTNFEDYENARADMEAERAMEGLRAAVLAVEETVTGASQV